MKLAEFKLFTNFKAAPFLYVKLFRKLMVWKIFFKLFPFGLVSEKYFNKN